MGSQRQLSEIREHLFTGVLSDALDGLGLRTQVVDLDFHHVIPGTAVVGRAQTARVEPVSAPRIEVERYENLMAAVAATIEGRVLVLAGPPSSTSALFGGLLATALSAAGGEGVIVNGYARDSREIRDVGVPAMVRGFRPVDVYDRDEVVEISGPVNLGQVVVRQDDLVFGDADGLVVVPAEVESEVIERSFDKVGAESQMRAALRDGMNVTDAFNKFGVL